MRLPNILFIVLDCARYDRLPYCRRQGWRLTPNIDRLAEQGLLATNAVSNAPWTIPSQTAMFTGRYPSEFGANYRSPSFPPNVPTIGELLAANGYQTIMASENNLVSYILKKGFSNDISYRSDRQPIRIVEKLIKTVRKRCVSNYKLHRLSTLVSPWYNVKLRRTESTFAFLQAQIDKAISADKPFLAFTNLMHTHIPYNPARVFWKSFLSDIHVTKVPNINSLGFFCEDHQLTERDLEIINRLYDSCLATADHCMVRLFELLKERRLLDEMLVIVTADHGENLGEHGMVGHQLCVYDTLVHVPLIVRYPPAIEPGLVFDGCIELRDLFHTMLDLVYESGCQSLQEHFDPNRSLLRRLTLSHDTIDYSCGEFGKPDFIRRRYEGRGGDLESNRYFRAQRFIRTEEFKFIEYDIQPCHDELFDIINDPQETRNLLADRPQEAQRLREQLHDTLGSLKEGALGEKTRGGDSTDDMDREVIQHLKSLGYY